MDTSCAEFHLSVEVRTTHLGFINVEAPNVHPDTEISLSPHGTLACQDEELTGHQEIELSPDQAVRLAPSG